MGISKAAWLSQCEVKNERDQILLSRSYDTLMGNLYDREGYPWSPYRCISPGKGYFKGIWNWDSAFHAIGVSRWDMELAKESILGFLKFQTKDGLIPDVVWEHGFVESRHSKPPVFAWACCILNQKEQDVEFLNKVYPMLVLNEKFLCKNRKYQDLFYYDASNREEADYLRFVQNESGWDNSVRWDRGITKLWEIDLNCFMVLFYDSLSEIAGKLSLAEESEAWRNKRDTLSKKINELMWDSKNHYYADVNRFTGEISDVLTPASFMPLYLGIASKEQADAMRVIAETNFDSKMPTVSFDDGGYSMDGYWRGPTWLNVAYFAAKGLKQYGFEVADRIWEWILEACAAEKEHIFENYDSITCKGMGCDHFSWSAVFIMEFILNWEV